MSAAFQELLAAVIDSLQTLKSAGVRYIPVDPESLAALGSPPAPSKPSPASPAPTAKPPTKSASPAPAAAPRPIPVAPSASTQTPILIPTPPLAAEGQRAAMDELRARALQCQLCPHLAATRRTVVFGVGDITSPLMFVGEAPGMDEDEAGEPFVGKAGQLLTRIIQTMGYSRDKVYIANVLKCRPDTPGQTFGNRKPTSQEMTTCLPYLKAQIDLIRPRIIVALGGTAVEGLLGLTAGITRLRGQFQQFQGIPVMPTFHPSYLLRNERLSVKRELWEDMLRVLEFLGAPISEKQRNFFLKQ